MIPFAELEPVQVSGVTVKLATLHNEEDLRRKDVRDGDEVIVTRAGDVIPQVVSPTAKAQKRKNRSDPPLPPARCPECDTPTIKPEGGVWTICPNRMGCPGQVLQAREALRRRDGHRRLRRGDGDPLPAREGDRERRRHLRARRGAAGGARGLRRDVGAQPARVDRAVEAAALLPRAVRARHRGRGLDQRACAGEPLPLDRRPARRQRGGSAGDGRHRPGDGPRDRSDAPGGAHARADRALSCGRG